MLRVVHKSIVVAQAVSEVLLPNLEIFCLQKRAKLAAKRARRAMGERVSMRYR